MPQRSRVLGINLPGNWFGGCLLLSQDEREGLFSRRGRRHARDPMNCDLIELQIMKKGTGRKEDSDRIVSFSLEVDCVRRYSQIRVCALTMKVFQALYVFVIIKMASFYFCTVLYLFF